MKNPESLSARESAFVSAFLASGNATGSAISANFSPKGASVAGNRMLRNVRVQKALATRHALDAARLSVRREDVLTALMEAVATAQVQRNPMAMISGLRELGRMMGFYAPEVKRVAITTDQHFNQNHMAAMTDAELLALMQGRVAVV